MMEFTTIPIGLAELKFTDDQSAFSGYASVFGGVDSYGDTIHPGAFSDVLARTDTFKMYLNHGWKSGALPIGKIRVSEDSRGLRVERAEFTPGLASANEAKVAVAHGTVDGLSIGWRPDPERTKRKSGGIGRDIYRVAYLKEISIVDWPADEAARISDIKSAIEAANTIREIETVLRDAAGLSRAVAETLVSKIKALGCGDRGAELTAEKIRRAFQQKIPG